MCSSVCCFSCHCVQSQGRGGRKLVSEGETAEEKNQVTSPARQGSAVRQSCITLLELYGQNLNPLTGKTAALYSIHLCVWSSALKNTTYSFEESMKELLVIFQCNALNISISYRVQYILTDCVHPAYKLISV